MAEEVIGLLFGVEGVGVNGASGQEIVKGLTQIVNEINSGKSTVPKIKFHFDTTEATKAVDDLKAKLKDIEKIASIKVTYSNGKGGKGGGGSLTQELKKEMSEALALQRKISGTKVTLGKLELEGGNANQIAEYTSQLERLEEQYSQLMQTFMKKVTGNAGDIMFDDIKSFSDQYANLGQIADDTLAVARAKETDIQAASAQKQKYDELSATIKEWVQASKQGAKLAAEYSTVTRQADGTIVGSTEGYEKTIAAINSVNNAMKELRITFDDKGQPIKPDAEEFARIAAEIGITEEQYQKLFEQVQVGSDTVGVHIENAHRKAANDTAKHIRNVTEQIDRVYDTISKNPAIKKMADDIRKYMKSGEVDVGELKNKFDEFYNAAVKSGAILETWGDQFKKTFAGKVRSALAAAITAAFTKYLREIYQNVVNIDKALVNLQIASGKTRTETKALLKEYAALAKQLGATTIEVAEAADTWLRQGYSAEEANTLITNSMMLSKLGQMESAEASKALTSAMKGYGVAVEDSVQIVDKLTKVDMEAAASAGDIATAMAETATSAKLSGVSMDTLIGYLTTVKEVTQDGSESVGVFFKTLFARMNNITAGKFIDDETGESLNDVESVLHKLDIELRGANDEFRNLSDVLGEVAARWDDFSDTERNAIATAMAGARNFEKFNVLMSNYGTAMGYATTATEAGGTAAEKYEAHLSGIKGKMDTLSATFEEFSITFLNSEWVSACVEALTGIVEILTAIAGVGNGVVTAIIAITTAILLLNAAFNAVKSKLTALIMKYAELAGVQVTGTITTKAFTAALLQFSSTGLLGVITTIPRFIAAVIKYIVAAKAGTGATLTFKGALDLLKVNPWVLLIEAIILAIVAAVAAINKFANAAAEASAEAKEHAKSMKEAADKAKEEQDALDDLINKYEELKSKGTIDSDTRKEIRDVQKQINLLVKGEAAEWDMVNGSLDENLKKLKQLRAEKAGESLKAYQQSYSAAQTSSNLAYESDRSAAGWAEWAANGAGLDLVVDGWDKQAAEILNGVSGVSAQWDSNLFSTFTDVNFDADGAEEYVDRITAAMNALENDMNYDHLHSKVYSQLSTLKTAYESYTSATTEAADQLLEGVVKFSGATLEANGAAINSLEDYEKFKQSMIDAAMSSEYLKDALASQAVTQQTVTEAVNDYMATNYADLYDKLAAEGAKSNYQLKTFLEILEEVQGEFDILSQALDDMDEYGFLSADTLSKLLDPKNGYPALAKYLTMTANGYTIVDDALEQCIKDMQDDYVLALIMAEEGTEAYDIAYQSLERFLAVMSTLQLTREIERETKALENERDAWEDQLDKYKELIDLRKDLLDTYAEELEYQKELEKKQRAVSTLQTKLSVARLDSSAAGQARVRELEAELKEAQEELEDFTLEHAIDVLTDQLDNQYKQYENFIETKVSEITDAINGVTAAIQGNAQSSPEQIKELMEQYKTEHPEVEDAKTTASAKEAAFKAAQDYVTSHGMLEGNKNRWGQDANFLPLLRAYLNAGGSINDLKGATNTVRGESKEAARKAAQDYIDSHGMLEGDKARWGQDPNFLPLLRAYIATGGSINDLVGKTRTYHTGGIVGDVSHLSSTEEFAKLLKGEFVSTPAQMKRFMEETLPQIANYSASGSSNEFNAPLIEITCESVTTEALPELERVVDEAVREIKKQLDSGMSRTGYKRTPTKRLT